MRSHHQRSRRRLLKGFLSSTKGHARTAPSHRFPLQVEGIEARLLLTSYAAINLVNNAGQRADTVINSGQPFTTSFLGTGAAGLGDVTIIPISVTTPYVISENSTFKASVNGFKNPSAEPNFSGSPIPPTAGQTLPLPRGYQGTGAGVQGNVFDLLSGDNDQIDISFSNPITSTSLIQFTDVDAGEKLTITAFDANDNPITLDGWSEIAYTGGTGQSPTPGTNGWAQWSVGGSNGAVVDTTGTLESKQDGSDLVNPLNILTIAKNVAVSSLHIHQTTFDSGGSGGAGIQVLSPGSGLSNVSGSGPFGGTAALSATLDNAVGSPLVGQPVIFNVDEGGTYTYVGTANTDQNGIATLNGISLAGLATGTTEPVMAIYSGDLTDSPVTAYGTLTVTQATPIITWQDPSPITYGTKLSSTQLDASPSVPGSFKYSPDTGATLPAGQDTLSATFTPTDTTDYATVTTSVMINVLKATPVITWPTPANITFGTMLGPTQLDATASFLVGGSLVNVPGTFNYSPTKGTLLNVGAGQTLTVSFTPADTTDYTSANASTTINVALLTSTSLSTPSTTAAFGQSVTLTAAVSVPPGTGSPVGSVTFLDGTKVLGSAKLDSTGHATFSTAALPLGQRSITASYPGTSTDASSTSPTIKLYVGDLVKYDFDGDGKDDLAVYGPVPGTKLYGFTILTSSSNFTKTVVWDNQGFGFGNASSIPVVGDYFGEGKDAYAIFTPDGHGFMLFQAISSVNPAEVLSIDFGLTTDTPVVADVDGDGKDDFGVYGFDANLGYRYDFLLSSKNFSASQPLIFNNYGFGYGTPQSTPVVADFDGAGHAGFGVYIPSGAGGTFTYTNVTIPKGTTGPIVNPPASDYFARTYGFATDEVTAVDYDGDGKADLAFYGLDPRTGRYRYDILTSSSNFSTTKDVYFDNAGLGYGFSASIPVMADYEGDGSSDFAVYQPDGAGGASYIFQDVGVGHGVVYDFATATEVPADAPTDVLARKVRGH